MRLSRFPSLCFLGFLGLILIDDLVMWIFWRSLQVEGIVKTLAAAGDHDKITAVINLLTTEYTFSPQANHRKVLFPLGWIGLDLISVFLDNCLNFEFLSVGRIDRLGCCNGRFDFGSLTAPWGKGFHAKFCHFWRFCQLLSLNLCCCVFIFGKSCLMFHWCRETAWMEWINGEMQEAWCISLIACLLVGTLRKF